MASKKSPKKRIRRPEVRGSVVPARSTTPSTHAVHEAARNVIGTALTSAGGSLVSGLAVMATQGPTGLALGTLVAFLWQTATSAPASIDAAMQMEAFRALSSRVDAMNERIKELRKRRPNAASPVEIANVLMEAARVYQSAMDENMKEVAGAAAENAFDAELYDADLNRHLFTLLRELYYGDLELLRRVAEAETKMQARVKAEVAARGEEARVDPRTFADLIEPFHSSYDLEMMHANRLMERGLIALMNESTHTGASRQVFATRLGRLMLKLARETREPNWPWRTSSRPSSPTR